MMPFFFFFNKQEDARFHIAEGDNCFRCFVNQSHHGLSVFKQITHAGFMIVLSVGKM